jgi:hypothetical protein
MFLALELNPACRHLMAVDRVDLDDGDRLDADLHHPAPDVVGVEAEGAFPETEAREEIVQGPLVGFDCSQAPYTARAGLKLSL